ncbi:uncharacterized protein PG986_000173 [Apiospora aurea]|uniref:NADAR domain-containing protein n=1 Tax=Apiospora aurea TaxID=335848 RepID=A0ABR1QU77_9PEZI
MSPPISFQGFDGSASTTPDSPVVFFWGTNETYGMFSQWYTAGFSCDGNRFATAEQYMMYRKAEAFGDAGAADAILGSPKKHPRQHKAMGRNVQGFRDDVWDAAGVEAVVVGNLCKFTQNPALTAALVGTAGSVLAEASPYDYIWGIGFKEEDMIQHMSGTRGFHKITSTDAIAQICSDKQTDTNAGSTVPDKTQTDTDDGNTAIEKPT